MDNSCKVVIVGGVACGPKTASRLKRLMPEAQVTMVDKGSVLSYGACGLPYYISGEVERLDALMETPVGVKRNAGFFNKVKGFKALTETMVEQIDCKQKVVRTKHVVTGDEQILPYDKLVLSTGANPVVPPIPGKDLSGVYQMHRMEDAAGVKEAVDQGHVKQAVIIGAGLIGVEMAEALALQGVAVTLVEMLPTVMGLLMDEEMSLLAMKHMEEKGIRLRMNEKVEVFEGDEKGRLKKVRTSQGEIDADLAILAIGVRPNNELAEKAGLALDQKGGIQINTFCQTSDPDIYAGGDCVSNACLQGVRNSDLYAPQGSTANKHGRLIANHIAGRPEPFSGVLGTVICKVFDITLARTGLTASQAKGLGYDVETVSWAGTDLPHFLSDSKPFCIKLVMDRRTRRLIGFQAVGGGGVDKRLDVAATAMSFRATVDDLAQLDLGYAPPYAPPLDPLLTAAHIGQNKLDGIANSINPMELKKRLEQGDHEIVLLDVRSPEERAQIQLPYEERTMPIPLGDLRERMHDLPKNKWIVPFCKISLRGYEAERILSHAGFSKVMFLESGIVGWPYEVVTT